MKQERLKELLQVAETKGSAAALKIAQETGDVEIDQVEVSEAMQVRIAYRQSQQNNTRNAIKGLKQSR